MTLARSTPLPKRRAKPRRTTSPRCAKQRCNRRAEIEGLCISHAEGQADDAFQRWVRHRDGLCTAGDGFGGVSCFGVLSAAHVVGRKNHSVRYYPDNVHALCSAHHVFVDQHGRENAKFIWASGVLGADRFAALMYLAGTVVDRRESVSLALARYRNGAK
jgi:hypothetical protein